MRSYSRLTLASFAAATVIAACGGGDGGTSVDPTGDVIEGEVDTSDTSSTDVGTIDDDTGEPDAADTTPDTPPDTSDASDTERDTADVATAGAIGDPCTEDDDCETFVCLQLDDGADGLCSAPCAEDEDCPDEWACLLVAGSADAERLCVPIDLCVDEDEDGRGVGPGCIASDCDDRDPNTYLGADERCDGIDNDCDDEIDENPLGTGDDCVTAFPGACAEGRTSCVDGLLECVSRSVPTDERCNERDDDCDGETDEAEPGVPLSRPCFDGDPDVLDVGVCTGGAQICDDGGFSACVGQVLPGPELCDGEDNDCDGEIDEDLTERAWYRDADGDDFGEAGSEPIFDCLQPPGYVSNDADCNDDDGGIRPGATEIAGDGIDQNCDESEVCFADADDDGWRPDATRTTVSDDLDCDDPGEAVAADPVGDCRDDDPGVNPDADERVGDGVDTDCDGEELCWPDGDGDGWRPDPAEPITVVGAMCIEDGVADDGVRVGDCNDDAATANPDADEVCDGIDNDCDDRVDEGNRCLPIGEPCLEDIDCADLFCDAGFCADPAGCAVPGRCPSRVGVVSGGRDATDRFRVDVSIGGPVTTTRYATDRFQIEVGVHAWIEDSR